MAQESLTTTSINAIETIGVPSVGSTASYLKEFNKSRTGSSLSRTSFILLKVISLKVVAVTT